MAKKKEENFFYTKKALPLWILCAPAALVGSALKQGSIEAEKKRKKRVEKDKELFYRYGAWGYWW